MSEGGTLTFTDPDRYAAAFGGVRLSLTITGAGDFKAQLTRLKLQHSEIYGCRETRHKGMSLLIAEKGPDTVLAESFALTEPSSADQHRFFAERGEHRMGTAGYFRGKVRCGWQTR
jgi:hypothetical protein